MKTKSITLITVIGILTLLLPLAVQAQTENKVLSITDPINPTKATQYSGTYVYQGTRSSGGAGTVKVRPYYKNGSYYLYADYVSGRTDFPNGFQWVIVNGSISSPISVEYVYYGWESSDMNYPSSSGPAWNWYWGDFSNNEVTVVVTNAASGVAPTVSTMEASLVTTTSGTMGGNVTADGGATTDRGFVYSSTDATPTIGESGVTQITKGTGTGTYTEVVSGLTAGVTYYYQAYGHNTYGTTYGTVKSFTTPTTSSPNKYVSNAGGANGIYVWIGEYYGKPAWKHETLNYWLYYSMYGMAMPDQHFWYIDNELKDEHGAEDFNYDHVDAATCPSSGWRNPDNSAASVAISDYPQIDFTDGSAYSPGNPTANTNNNPIGRFLLDADIAGSSLTAVTITAAGTRSNITNLKLWSSSDATFNSGSDTQLNSQSDGATVAFSGFSSSISTSGTYYFVTADLASDATGTFTLTIGSKTNLTYSGGASSTVFSNAALTSGTLSIIALPTVSTTAASSIGTTFATLGGNVSASGGATVDERGVVYSSSDNTPTIGEGGVTKDNNGSGIGIFSESIGSLSTGTTYHFQAYAINSTGTAYGGVESFTTLEVPTVTTQAVTDIGKTTATGNGNITDLGVPNPTAHGVCWNTTEMPTTSDNLTNEGSASATGAFTADMTSLTPGTTYYVRAYASNSAGTGYGSQVEFATSNVDITFTDGSAFTPDVTKGNANQVLGRFQLTADVAGASLTAASIKLNGTRTGLYNLKLWESSDATFDFNEDNHLGYTVDDDPGDGNTVSFSSLSSTIGTSGTYYFLTGDVDAGATGTVQGVIVQNSDLTLDKGTLSETITDAPLSGGDVSLPVELISFSARAEGRSIILSWITESETDNAGFILERKSNNADWKEIASYKTNDALKGQGNTSSRTEYTFTDQTVESGKEYAYRLSDVSTKGEITEYASLSVKMDELPETTKMRNAYPNPFNPETYIAYQLSKDTDVNITVFDMLGRHVKTLYDGRQLIGSYHVYWNGTNETGMKSPSGNYFIRMKTESITQVQKVMLMK